MAPTIRWRLRLPQELEEVFTAELWARGSLGMEVRDGPPTAIDAYFPEPLPTAAAAFDLATWQLRGVELVDRETLAERDWLADYRQVAGTLELGRGFRVEVGDAGAGEDADDGRTLLRIPAQTAFGTGSHESTRLVVRWLEALDLEGADVLDVGTGSGILSFVAEHLGACRTVAFDRDLQAVCIARANAHTNGLRPRLFAGRLEALRRPAAFDLALVNILPDHVLEEIPRLVPLLGSDGRVISSGNLWSRRDELVERFAAAGLVRVDELRQGEWVAFLLRPAS